MRISTYTYVSHVYIYVYFSGNTFEKGVVGKAVKGVICTYEYSGGVNMVRFLFF